MYIIFSRNFAMEGSREVKPDKWREHKYLKSYCSRAALSHSFFPATVGLILLGVRHMGFGYCFLNMVT